MFARRMTLITNAPAAYAKEYRLMGTEWSMRCLETAISGQGKQLQQDGRL